MFSFNLFRCHNFLCSLSLSFLYNFKQFPLFFSFLFPPLPYTKCFYHSTLFSLFLKLFTISLTQNFFNVIVFTLSILVFEEFRLVIPRRAGLTHITGVNSCCTNGGNTRINIHRGMPEDSLCRPGLTSRFKPLFSACPSVLFLSRVSHVPRYLLSVLFSSSSPYLLFFPTTCFLLLYLVILFFSFSLRFLLFSIPPSPLLPSLFSSHPFLLLSLISSLHLLPSSQTLKQNKTKTKSFQL